MILEGGASRVGIASTVVEIAETGKIVIHRPGALSERQLRGIIEPHTGNPR
jgi:tRNA A37 threonylcarbamoyladenosine synthetase subunit TsaC/SUA5/YrdC